MSAAKPYVYKLTHRETGEFYYGSRGANKVVAEDDLVKVYKSSSKIIAKLGIQNFDSKIIMEYEDSDIAYYEEQRLIEISFNDSLCLNRHYVRDGNQFFKTKGPLTEEHKNKVSVALLGRVVTDGGRKKISNARIGIVFTSEHRENISLAKIGIPISEEHKKAISSGSIGKKLTNEHKEKITGTLLGRKHSKERKKNQSLAKLGKVNSAQHNKNISIAMIGKKRGPYKKTLNQPGRLLK